MLLDISLSFTKAPAGNMVLVYGVQTSAPQAYPTVWRVQCGLGTAVDLVIPWEDALAVYYSDSKFAPDDTVRNIETAQCQLSNTCCLDTNQVMQVSEHGPKGQVSLFNGSYCSWVFGCCLNNGEELSPHFACSLGPEELVEAIPGPYLLVYFTTEEIAAGQIIGPTPFDKDLKLALPFGEIVRIDLSLVAQLAATDKAALTYTSGRWQLPPPFQGGQAPICPPTIFPR